MDEKKLDKLLKDSEVFAIIVLVLVVIVLASELIVGPMQIDNIVRASLQLVLLIANAIGCRKKKVYGPACGIAVATLLIASQSIISLVIGTIYLVECVIVLKNMKD